MGRASNSAIFVSLDFSHFTAQFMSLHHIVIYDTWVLCANASNCIDRASLAQQNDTVHSGEFVAKLVASSLNLTIAKILCEHSSMHISSNQLIFASLNPTQLTS